MGFGNLGMGNDISNMFNQNDLINKQSNEEATKSSVDNYLKARNIIPKQSVYSSPEPTFGQSAALQAAQKLSTGASTPGYIGATTQPTTQPITQPISEPISEPIITPEKSPLLGMGPRPKDQAFNSFMSTKPNNLDLEIESDDPEVSANAIEKIGRIDPKKIDPNTPTGTAWAKINDQYLVAEDPKAGPIYKCPYTQVPCGKKTFFRRLKEFFLHMVGKKSQEELDSEIQTLNKKDNITKTYFELSKTEPATASSDMPDQYLGKETPSGIKGAL